MNPWYAKVAVLVASVVLVVIRAPHGRRAMQVAVRKSYRGRVEIGLLTLAWVSFFVPLVWVASPVFAFADYRLHAVPYAAGLACYACGLWLFHASHRDLGPAWSITLEVREAQRVVDHGCYRRIRHPMYAALLLYSLGQGLVLPNWLAGPSYLVAMTLLIALRLRAEEAMMHAEFGAAYAAYAARTWRLVPGLW